MEITAISIAASASRRPRICRQKVFGAEQERPRSSVECSDHHSFMRNTERPAMSVQSYDTRSPMSNP